MLDRDDLQLIERHLDGELTPAEEGRLKSLLAGSGEARTLVAALRSLDEGDREAAIPPADAVPQIMARVRELPRPQQAGLLSRVRTNAARAMAALMETSGLATGTGSHMEDVMSSRAKIVFGISAAAVALLIGVYMMGFYPPVDEGAATIGAAKRYQAPQMAASDVKLGDQQAQKFMQSDTFDRILKDPNARKLLANAKFQEFFSDPQISPALKHSEFGAALKQIATDANLKQIFGDAEMAQAIGNDDIAAALVDVEMLGALKDERVEAALGNQSIRDAFADPATRHGVCG